MARNVTSKFGVADGLDFSSEQGITSIAIDKLVPYRNHRFTLYKGERLEDMIQSITKNGVITPIIVRTLELWLMCLVSFSTVWQLAKKHAK